MYTYNGWQYVLEYQIDIKNWVELKFTKVTKVATLKNAIEVHKNKILKMFAFCGKVIFAKFAFIANSKQLFIS